MQIYCGGLTAGITEEKLEGLFRPFGAISRISLPWDYKGNRPRGYAFMVMPDDTEARAAILGLDGKEIDGRTLRVSRAFSQGPIS